MPEKVILGKPVHANGFFIVVLCCIALHLTWAGLIMADPATVNVTSVSGPFSIFKTRQMLAISLVGCAIAAIGSSFVRFPWNMLMLLPQQTILQMSAASSFLAIIGMQYADGVTRPLGFIFADQLHSILFALGHALAIVALGAVRNE